MTRDEYLARRTRDLEEMRRHPLSLARRLYMHYWWLEDFEACQEIMRHVREREPRETPYASEGFNQ